MTDWRLKLCGDFNLYLGLKKLQTKYTRYPLVQKFPIPYTSQQYVYAECTAHVYLSDPPHLHVCFKTDMKQRARIDC